MTISRFALACLIALAAVRPAVADYPEEVFMKKAIPAYSIRRPPRARPRTR
jgi:hypothetical protein